jgi:LDH2 family malate/lactate/ureidoglycolate dehydrogenase
MKKKMSEMMSLKPDVVKTYVIEILKRNNVPQKKARVTAEVLVEADMRGVFSHGINSLNLLVLSSIRQGGTVPDAETEDKSRNKNLPIRHIDAKGGLGHPVAMEAVERVKRLARKHGLGKVYVSNANHFGMAAVYSERICAEKDLAGRVTCTTPSVVRPYGGMKKRLGTNLISWSIPYDRGTVTIDMSTTIHAISGLLRAFLECMELPFPVYDEAGLETTDPLSFKGMADFLKKGSMIPLGGIGKGGADAGYKGTGLATLIELDNVIGGGASSCIDPLVNDERRRIRQAFEAWRIDTLFPQEQALHFISKTVADIKHKQGKGMFLPGEKEAKRREASIRKGISYTAGQIERLQMLGREVGLGDIV